MFTARFLQTTDRTLPCRSKLFSRRAGVRCRHIDPAQLPSDMTADAVTPERTIAPAIVDVMAPTGIHPSTDDLVIAPAEPATEVPDAGVASASAPVVEEVISAEATSVETTTADAPEKVPSAPATKGKKRGRKTKKLVSDSVRPKPLRRKERSAEESGAGTAHALEIEQ